MQELSKSVVWVSRDTQQAEAPLNGDEKVDVAIVGGGLTGLWSAYLLLKENHGLKIAILEANEIGFGASGRSAGFINPFLHRSLPQLVRLTGVEEARKIYDATLKAMDMLGEIIETEHIHCEFNQNCGLVRSSNLPPQDARIQSDLSVAEKLGVGDDIVPLSRDEIQERLHSDKLRCGYFLKKASLLNPVQLLAGLKLRVQEMGCKIYENTRVLSWQEQAHSVTVRTKNGTVWADRAIICGNAYSQAWKPTRKDVFSVYSYVCATPILAEREWDNIGWQQREGWEDKRFMNLYFRPTDDGRVLWGGKGIGLFMGQPKAAYDQYEIQFRQLRESFRWFFPQLRQVPFEFKWGGAIGVTSNSLPNIGFFDPRKKRVAHAYGFNGHGMVASLLGANVVRDLFEDRQSSWVDLYFVNMKQATSSQFWVRNAAYKSLSRTVQRADDEGRPAKKSILLRALEWAGIEVPEIKS